MANEYTPLPSPPSEPVKDPRRLSPRHAGSDDRDDAEALTAGSNDIKVSASTALAATPIRVNLNRGLIVVTSQFYRATNWELRHR
jgi:hypothetical protein